MKNFRRTIILACGLLLMLAAIPVCAQEKVEINRMPFKDLAQTVKQRVDEKKVDLTKPFLVELEGVLNKDGRLDAKKSRFVKSEGDAAMIEVGKNFIEAIANAGLFIYLKNLGVENVNFTLAQDDSDLYAVIISEKLSPERTMPLTRVLEKLINDLLIKGTSVDSSKAILNVNVNKQDKNFSVKFAYDKSIIQEVIKQKLEESKQRLNK